jgi:putative ABC transport system permease protein
VDLQNIRYALRSLGRTPGFTAVALLTLALGIGGTTAIFSVVDAILLRPLPYPQPDTIVSLVRSVPNLTDGGAFSPADYVDYRRDSRSFAAIAGYREDPVDLTGSTAPVRLTALETTAGFFEVFGLPPIEGRVYRENTDAAGGPRVAVVSEGMWRQHLGGDTSAVGRTIRLNGIPMTVLGIMPSTFVHPANVDLWILAPEEVPTAPIHIQSGDLVAQRELSYFQAVARLAPGVSRRQADADLQRIDERLAREFPNTNAGETTRAVPYHESLVGDVRTALLVLLGAVGFVLLIACANVASLLLARGAARRREFAVRTALGAGRSRLVRQLVTESLVLAGAGGFLGLGVAFWSIDALVALAPDSIPRLGDVRLDPRVATFTVAVSIAVGLLFGVAPAFRSARPDVIDALAQGGRSGTARTGPQRLLVVAEVALALVLLIGAGLMLTSFSRLRAVDPGFRVSDLVVVGVPLPQARYERAAQVRFYTSLYEQLLENPVTARAALVFPTPFGGAAAVGGYLVEGAPPGPRNERPSAELTSVTPGYFQTLGIAFLQGGDVSLADGPESAAVALVNRTLAEREWPGRSALGQRVNIGGDPNDPASWFTIVGVVGDAKRDDLSAGPKPAIYLPHARFTVPYMGVVTRTDATASAVASAVAAAVRTLDADLPIEEVQTLEHTLAETTGQPRFRALVVGVFAAMALVLAAVGLYGVVSYTVAQRVPEIGVRLALGATPGEIGRLVVGQGLALAAAGVGIGLAAALATTRLLDGLLFSVSATDPRVYGGLAALLIAVASFACYVPARRAMRVDPMAALRAD